jgi:MSHA biogenesis protein MshJ
MSAFRAQLKQLADRIDALSVRERAMTFLVVMGLICYVAWTLLFAPLRAEHARVTNALTSKNEQIDAMNRQMQAMLSGESSDQRTALLKQELKSVEQELERAAGGMVSPQQMAKFLEQVLARQRRVELIKIETLPRTVAFDGNATGDKSADAVVYRHGVRIQVRGGYFDLVNYLKELEALDWRVYWGQVNLDAGKHPLSEVTVIIYTLSRHPGWIGA